MISRTATSVFLDLQKQTSCFLRWSPEGHSRVIWPEKINNCFFQDLWKAAPVYMDPGSEKQIMLKAPPHRKPYPLAEPGLWVMVGLWPGIAGDGLALSALARRTVRDPVRRAVPQRQHRSFASPRSHGFSGCAHPMEDLFHLSRKHLKASTSSLKAACPVMQTYIFRLRQDIVAIERLTSKEPTRVFEEPHNGVVDMLACAPLRCPLWRSRVMEGPPRRLGSQRQEQAENSQLKKSCALRRELSVSKRWQ